MVKNSPSRIRCRRQKLARTIATHTKVEWQSLVAEFNGICVRFLSAPFEHKDHIVSLDTEGYASDGIDNLQPLCAFCNMSKRNRDEVNWVSIRRQQRDNPAFILEPFLVAPKLPLNSPNWKNAMNQWQRDLRAHLYPSAPLLFRKPKTVLSDSAVFEFLEMRGDLSVRPHKTGGMKGWIIESEIRPEFGAEYARHSLAQAVSHFIEDRGRLPAPSKYLRYTIPDFAAEQRQRYDFWMDTLTKDEASRIDKLGAKARAAKGGKARAAKAKAKQKYD